MWISALSLEAKQNFVTCSDAAQAYGTVTFPHFYHDVHPSNHSAERLSIAAMPALP